MLYYGCKGPVLTLRRGVREDHVLQALLHDFDHELRPPIVLTDGAAVAAAAVVSAEAPVDARGLVAHWIEGSGTVEVGHLVGQQLSNGVEHKAPHPEHVQPLSPLDDAGNLLHLRKTAKELSSCSQGPLILCIGHSMVLSLKNMHFARMAQAKW